MQRLPLGLELHDLVLEGGHLGLNAVGRLALFEDLGAERLLMDIASPAYGDFGRTLTEILGSAKCVICRRQGPQERTPH
jgi:hypothetical protein